MQTLAGLKAETVRAMAAAGTLGDAEATQKDWIKRNYSIGNIEAASKAEADLKEAKVKSLEGLSTAAKAQQDQHNAEADRYDALGDYTQAKALAQSDFDAYKQKKETGQPVTQEEEQQGLRARNAVAALQKAELQGTPWETTKKTVFDPAVARLRSISEKAKAEKNHTDELYKIEKLNLEAQKVENARIASDKRAASSQQKQEKETYNLKEAARERRDYAKERARLLGEQRKIEKTQTKEGSGFLGFGKEIEENPDYAAVTKELADLEQAHQDTMSDLGYPARGSTGAKAETKAGSVTPGANDKVVGHTPDGKKVYENKDGKRYTKG
jgi:hypothetical protein